jgi:hypothetical protein
MNNKPVVIASYSTESGGRQQTPRVDPAHFVSGRSRRRRHVNRRHKDTKQRGKIFADWVMHEFAEIFSNDRCIIVDVAGGKGEVSFKIVTECARANCLIIDPACISLSNSKTKYLIRRGRLLRSG